MPARKASAGRPPAAPEPAVVELSPAAGVEPLRLRVVRRPRLRGARLVVPAAGRPELRLGPRVPLAEALRFAESKEAWLRAALARRKPPPSLEAWLRARPGLALGEGAPHAVELVEGAPARRLEVGPGAVVRLAPGRDGREARLAALLRQLAEIHLPEAVARLARQVAARPGRVTVRDQRSRWGSCSARAGVSLNWRLILLPPALRDHIILHELAHLVHLHHGPAFWELLRRYDPQTAAHEKAIAAVEGDVMGLGRR